MGATPRTATRPDRHEAHCPLHPTKRNVASASIATKGSSASTIVTFIGCFHAADYHNKSFNAAFVTVSGGNPAGVVTIHAPPATHRGGSAVAQATSKMPTFPKLLRCFSVVRAEDSKTFKT